MYTFISWFRVENSVIIIDIMNCFFKGICAVTTTWAAVTIGAVGACVTIFGQILLIKLKIDDPVGASAIHFMGSIWGMLCCGIFAQKDNIENSFSHENGFVWVSI